MYCKLLDEVVKEMKGIEVKEEVDVQIELDVSSYIPEDFISDSNQKIEVYQNIALCQNEEDIRNIIDEIIDRYGSMPDEIEKLLDIARIRNLSREKNINKIVQRNDRVIFYFDEKNFDFSTVDKLLKLYVNRIRFSPARSPYITFDLRDNNNVTKEVKEFLSNI